MNIDIAPFIKNFQDYAASFAEPGRELAFAHQLKLAHTMEVLDYAEKIMVRENITDPRLVFTGKLTALFHDLARFDQYKQYRTFRDNADFNHGHQAADMLEKGPWLDRIPADIRAAVIAAVRVHNARVLPEDLPSDALFPARLVRDADKLSIYHVVLDYFHHREEYQKDPAVSLELPETPEIDRTLIAKIRQGQSGDYRQLTNVNAFLINLFSWVHDLNFTASCRIAAEEKIYPQLRELLPPDDELDELCRIACRTAEEK
jgi:hypothetical protein